MQSELAVMELPAETQSPACGNSVPGLETDLIVKALRVLAVAARTDASVLLRAGRGDGIQILARAMHSMSQRRAGNFVAVRCGLYPVHITARRLLGSQTHRRSFVRTRGNQPGEIDQAHNGTLFLEHVQHVSAPVQEKLSQVLREGGARVIVSAIGLPERVKAKMFRADLLEGISAVAVDLPRAMETRTGLMLALKIAEQSIHASESEFFPRASSQEMLELIAAIRRIGAHVRIDAAA